MQEKLSKIGEISRRNPLGVMRNRLMDAASGLLVKSGSDLRYVGIEPHRIGEGLSPLIVLEARRPTPVTLSRRIITDHNPGVDPGYIENALVQPGQSVNLTMPKGSLFIRFPFTPRKHQRMIYATDEATREENKEIFNRMLPHMIDLFRHDEFYAPRIRKTLLTGSTNERYFSFMVRHYNACNLWGSSMNEFYDSEARWRGGDLDENIPFAIEAEVFVQQAEQFLASRSSQEP